MKVSSGTAERSTWKMKKAKAPHSLSRYHSKSSSVPCSTCSEHHFQITPTKRTDTTFRDDNIRRLWCNGRMNLRCGHCRLQWRLLLFDGREGLIIRMPLSVSLARRQHACLAATMLPPL